MASKRSFGGHQECDLLLESATTFSLFCGIGLRKGPFTDS
jgi:hypothetical protein